MKSIHNEYNVARTKMLGSHSLAELSHTLDQAQVSMRAVKRPRLRSKSRILKLGEVDAKSISPVPYFSSSHRNLHNV